MESPPRLPRAVRRALDIIVPRDRRDEVVAALEEGHRARLDRMPRWRAGLFLVRELMGLLRWRVGRIGLRPDPPRGPTGLVEELRQDARFAVRAMARRPAFSLTVVAVVALGIGAPTTIFSLVETVFFRSPEHVVEPDRLVRVHGVTGEEGRFRDLERPEFVHVRGAARTLSALAAYGAPTVATYHVEGGGPQQLELGFVSPEYFDVLGTRMALGRDFRADEDVEPGAHPRVILSHGFWTRALAADPSVVGRGFTINGSPYTVVGVAPVGFSGVSPVETAPDAWVPVAMYGAVSRAPNQAWWGRVPGQEITWLRVVGRLADGVAADAARSEIETLAETVPREVGNDGQSLTVTKSVAYSPEQQVTLSNLTRLLLGAVSLVAVVALANVALLLLTWASARTQELGVRRALGAGRARIVRQLLTESLILALGGGLVGVALSLRLSSLAGELLPYRFVGSFRPGWPVLAIALGLTTLTALVSGIVPAVRASLVDPVRTLKGGTSGPSGAALRRGLVVFQVGLSVMLVSGALLLAGSFWTAQNQELGFEPDNRLALLVDLGARGYGPEDGRPMVRRSLERLRALPGVLSATTAVGVPFRGGWSTNLPEDPGGGGDGETFRSTLNVVSPDYFRVWGTALISGRGIEPTDTGDGPIAVVVNRTLANRYWPAADPIGRVIDRGYDQLRVVGVSQDAVARELGEAHEPQVYVSLEQRWMPYVHFLLHTSGDAAALAPAAQAALREIDPQLTFPWIGTMESVLHEQTARYRASALLMSAFGLTALVLAVAGLYGVMSFMVGRRTREIGVRMALGASAGDILRRVITSGGRMVLVGVALGLVGYVLLRRLAEALLFGVSVASPVPPLLAVLVLAVSGLVAASGPALRASRIEPREAISAD